MLKGRWTPTVIISYYEQYHRLLCLVKALGCQSPACDLELIVCDDGSSVIPSLNEIRTTAELRSHISLRILSQSHVGNRVSAARNLGIRSAEGTYCIFLDADTLVPSDFIENYRRSASEMVILCGTRFNQFALEDSTLLGTSLPVVARDREFRVSLARRQREMLKTSSPWRACIGCNFGVSRTQVLYFNEAFVGRAPEDLELACRLVVDEGYMCSVNNRLCVGHYQSVKDASRWRDIQHHDIVYCLRNALTFVELYPDLDLASSVDGVGNFYLDEISDTWRLRFPSRCGFSRSQVNSVLEVAAKWLRANASQPSQV